MGSHSADHAICKLVQRGRRSFMLLRRPRGPLLLGRILLDPSSHFLDFRTLSVDDLLRHGF